MCSKAFQKINNEICFKFFTDLGFVKYEDKLKFSGQITKLKYTEKVMA